MKLSNRYIKHKSTCTNSSFVEIVSEFTTKNTLVLQFNIGSKDDPKKKQGMVHLIEHLLVKSSKEDILKREVEGINFFANTYKDRFVITIASYNTSIYGLTKYLCHKFNNFSSNLSDDTLGQEKKVIIAEINQVSESGNELIYDKVMGEIANISESSFEYTHPLRGIVESIQSISTQDIEQFIQDKLFNPIIAVTSKTFLSETDITSIFNSFDNCDILRFDGLKSDTIVDKTLYKRPIEDVVNHQIDFYSQGNKVKGWIFVNTDTIREQIYLGILKEYLAGNWSSILNQKLRTSEQLVYFSNSTMFVFEKISILYTVYGIDKDKIDLADKIHEDVLANLYRGSINKDIFLASKNMRLSKIMPTFKDESDLLDDFVYSNRNIKLDVFYTLEEYLDGLESVSFDDFAEYVKSLFCRNV